MTQPQNDDVQICRLAGNRKQEKNESVKFSEVIDTIPAARKFLSRHGLSRAVL